MHDTVIDKPFFSFVLFYLQRQSFLRFEISCIHSRKRSRAFRAELAASAAKARALVL